MKRRRKMRSRVLGEKMVVAIEVVNAVQSVAVVRVAVDNIVASQRVVVLVLLVLLNCVVVWVVVVVV